MTANREKKHDAFLPRSNALRVHRCSVESGKFDRGEDIALDKLTLHFGPHPRPTLVERFGAAKADKPVPGHNAKKSDHDKKRSEKDNRFTADFRAGWHGCHTPFRACLGRTTGGHTAGVATFCIPMSSEKMGDAYRCLPRRCQDILIQARVVLKLSNHNVFSKSTRYGPCLSRQAIPWRRVTAPDTLYAGVPHPLG